MPKRDLALAGRLPVLPVGEQAGLLEPPAGLEPTVAEVWRRLAPDAVGEKTLTPATMHGFLQLCQQWVYAASLAAMIDTLGAGRRDAQGFISSYLRVAQRLDSSLGRFRLTAFGRSAVHEPAQPAANPWAALAK